MSIFSVLLAVFGHKTVSTSSVIDTSTPVAIESPSSITSSSPLPIAQTGSGANGNYVLDITSNQESITLKVNGAVIYSTTKDVAETGIAIPASVIKEGDNDFAMDINTPTGTGDMTAKQKLEFHIHGTNSKGIDFDFHDTEDLTTRTSADLPDSFTGSFNPVEDSWNIN